MMGKKGMLVLGVLWGLVLGVTSVFAYELPDTGITKCYNAAGSEITCPAPGEPFYGQDAQYAGPQPAYKDNGDGTVTDLNTGLMWQQGDTQNDSGGRPWQEACDYCSGLTLPSGGYSDWRLPNRRELMSIVIYGRYNPSIDTTYFPDCRSSNYWSSSTYAILTDFAWVVYFYGGGVDSYYGTNPHYVRCVRGGA
jgi:hypothetical protein